MKILISPSINLQTEYHYNRIQKLVKKITNFNCQTVIKSCNGELNHYGEITKILGKNNVFILNNVHKAYFGKERSENFNSLLERYPSNFFYEEPNFINYNQIKSQNIHFDFFLISIQSINKNFEIAKELKDKGVKIGLFDKVDDNQIYFDEHNYLKKINYELYDVVFKQDLPHTLNLKNIFPIAPVPSKIKLIKQTNNSGIIHNITTSFVGDYRKNVTRGDRKELVEFFEKNYPENTYISFNKKEYHKKSFLDELNLQSLFNLSPSGKVWDSYRHCELVNYGKPIILPEPDCKIAPGSFKDMYNCIFYKTEYKNGDYKIKDLKNLKKKIDIVMSNKKIRSSIYENYYDLIAGNHTRERRSAYLIEIMSSIIKR